MRIKKINMAAAAVHMIFAWLLAAAVFFAAGKCGFNTAEFAAGINIAAFAAVIAAFFAEACLLSRAAWFGKAEPYICVALLMAYGWASLFKLERDASGEDSGFAFYIGILTA